MKVRPVGEMQTKFITGISLKGGESLQSIHHNHSPFIILCKVKDGEGDTHQNRLD